MSKKLIHRVKKLFNRYSYGDFSIFKKIMPLWSCILLNRNCLVALFLSYWFCVCVCIYIRVWVPYTACLWRLEDNFEELGLAFHHLKQSLLFLPQAVYSSLEGLRASGWLSHLCLLAPCRRAEITIVGLQSGPMWFPATELRLSSLDRPGLSGAPFIVDWVLKC